jgi:hypothetical protein
LIHVLEYDAPTCQPREGRLVNVTSNVLKFESVAGLLMVIVFENAALLKLVG